MGIDVYASWPDMTPDEKEAQVTGFSTAHGYVGYLREAYHGGPYSTKVLVPEAFQPDEYPDAEVAWECDECLGSGWAEGHEPEDGRGLPMFADDDEKCHECAGRGRVMYDGAEIRPAKMAKRLPAALTAALVREAEVYGSGEARAILAELGHEPTLATGSHPSVIELDEAEDYDPVLEAVGGALEEAESVANGDAPDIDVPDGLMRPETLRRAAGEVAMCDSLVRYVALAVRKGNEHGRPVRTYASF